MKPELVAVLGLVLRLHRNANFLEDLFAIVEHLALPTLLKCQHPAILRLMLLLFVLPKLLQDKGEQKLSGQVLAGMLRQYLL